MQTCLLRPSLFRKGRSYLWGEALLSSETEQSNYRKPRIYGILYLDRSGFDVADMMFCENDLDYLKGNRL